ncbi:alpha/beta hydrolase [Serinicoccus profundi]|uniref:alpha/beta hydrolase n=1 Tax=Serinicoccus profundi TaxID=1078471 RepID=UPI000255EB8E|nr:alpha/beta hydrolase [Serinicoccus profundi]
MKLIWAAPLAAAAVAGLTKHRQVGRARPELRVPAAYTPNPLTDRGLPLMKAALARLPHTEDTGRTQVSVPSPDGPVPAFTYTPTSGEPHGALLWIHGGGRVLGSAAQDHDLCQMFADHAGVFVLSVDHRLAPEHPYPAPLDDCHAALTWLVERRGTDGPIVVGGASAGGGLAAELAQRAHDEGLQVDFQLLLYPMLDDRTLSHGPHDRGRLVWTPGANRVGWSAYLGHPAGQDEQRPYAVGARRDDLTGLPPAWIGVGDLDLFYDEDVDYARRLEAAGVAVELHVEEGMYHGADALPGASTTPAMVALRRRMAEALGVATARISS